MTSLFKISKDPADCRPGDVGERCDFVLTEIDLGVRQSHGGNISASPKAQKDRNATFDVIAKHQVIASPKSHIDVPARDEGKQPPCRGILGDDLVYLCQRQVKQLGVARRRQTDATLPLCNGRIFSEPRPRFGEMGGRCRCMRLLR